MGGYGSGRNGFSTTAKVDEGLKLDINKLKRDGMIAFNSHRSGSLTWTRAGAGEEAGSIDYEINTIDPQDMWMRVHYTHKSYWDDEPDKMDYKIRLETTQPNYGGKRLWFICPKTGQRAAVLHKPPGSKCFASRHAFNLKYQSQSRGCIDRAIDKKWKMLDKVDGTYFPVRPKGMHNKTFDKIYDEFVKQEMLCDKLIDEKLSTMVF